MAKFLFTPQPLKPEKEEAQFFILLTKFNNSQILLNKISHIFQVTTKLFSGRNFKDLITTIIFDKKVNFEHEPIIGTIFQ